ncbi:MAG: vitamin K epoxide reductase family protein [Patescibacteria group bacterium]
MWQMIDAHFPRRRLIILVLLSMVGLAAATYLMYKHYSIPTGQGFCNLSATISCDIVNQSTYAEIYGIPVSGIGALGYVAFFLLSLGLLSGFNFSKINSHLTVRNVTKVFLLLVFLGLLFSIYLTGVEIFILYAFCPFCLIQQGVILTMFGILVSLPD